MAQDSHKDLNFVAPSLEELRPLFPAYELEAFIAQGGMGAVYKATQRSLDRPVAIKILPAEFGADPKFRASFEAEAKAMARLNHPNLISVYDFGDVQGMLYIVMEFVQGKALYYSSHKKAIDPAVALDLVSTVCRGLGHAHQGGIIHRDIKPANILLDTDARPKIGDFGLAHSLDRGRDEGLVFGTPGYTAPEVFQEGAEVDARSDLFSVGALLYELISGKSPENKSWPLSTGTDPRIDAIITKATAVDPAQRYHDADQLADALDDLLPKLAGPRFATAPQPQSPGLTNPTVLASSRKSSGALPVFFTIFLLMGGATAAYFILRDPPPSTPPPVTETPKAPPEEPPAPNPKKPDRKPKPRQDRDRPDRSATTSNPDPAPDPEPKDPEDEVSPMEALAELAPDLRKGKRDEFPPTTVKDDQAAFFLVSTKLNWDEAQQFAREHGARLAVLPTRQKLTWVQENFQSDTPVWVGASDSGFEERWHWTDGSAVGSSLWAAGSPDNRTDQAATGEDFAALSAKKPVLEDHSRLLTLPFLLEWRLDGETPSSLEEQLERTGEALLKRQTPVFPAGTYNVGGSRFLLVKREIPWDEASNLATRGGGHLAVPSNEAEARFISLTLQKALADRHSCWMGGQRNPDSPDLWQYLTGETFTFLTWHEGQPDNLGDNQNRLAFTSQDGQIAASDESNLGHQNSHFLIEWSVPSLRNMPPVSAQGASDDRLLEALEAIREAIRRKHQNDYRRYRRERAEIIGDFVDNTITIINNQERLGPPIKARLVEEVKKWEVDDRLPKDLPPGTPNKIKDDLEEARDDLKELEEDYKDDYQDAKEDYLDELLEQSKKVLREGEEAKAAVFILENTVTKKNDQRFKEILDGKEVPLPEKPGEPDDNQKGED